MKPDLSNGDYLFLQVWPQGQKIFEAVLVLSTGNKVQGLATYSIAAGFSFSEPPEQCFTAKMDESNLVWSGVELELGLLFNTNMVELQRL